MAPIWDTSNLWCILKSGRQRFCALQRETKIAAANLNRAKISPNFEFRGISWLELHYQTEECIKLGEAAAAADQNFSKSTQTWSTVRSRVGNPSSLKVVWFFHQRLRLPYLAWDRDSSSAGRGLLNKAIYPQIWQYLNIPKKLRENNFDLPKKSGRSSRF